MRAGRQRGAVAAYVVIVAVLTGCVTHHDDSAAGSVDVRDGQSVALTTSDEALTVEIDGANVEGDGELRISEAESLSGVAGWEIDLAGSDITGPATIRFHRPDMAEGAPPPLVAYAPTLDGRLALAEDVTRTDEGAEVVTDHFSFWTVIWPGDLLDRAKSGLETLFSATARGRPPACENEQEVRDQGYAVSSDEGSQVMWCLGRDDAGRPVLKVVNRRGYAVAVEATPNLAVRGSAPDTLVTKIASVIEQPPSTPENAVTLLPAGGEIEFDLVGGGSATVRVRPSGPAYLLTAAQYAVDTYAMITGAAGIDVGRDALADAANWESCLAGLTDAAVAEVGSAADALSLLTNGLDASFACVKNASSAFVTGIPGATVLQVLSWLASGILSVVAGFSALADLVMDPWGYDIELSTPDGGPPTDPIVPPDRPSTDAPLLVLMDVSDSMDDDDGTGRIKLDGAKQAMADLVMRQRAGSRVGLWSYPAGSCTPGTMVQDVGTHDPSRTTALIRALTADGRTPTGDALAAAARSLRDGGHRTATFVLVSDGESNCGEPPCDVARGLVGQGFDITVSTVGFRTSEAGREELECVASVSGGQYYDVEDSEDLGDELRRLSGAELTVDVSHPDSVPVGSAASIEVSVRNDTAVDASDVKIGLFFHDTGESTLFPAVVPPRYGIGNLPAGRSSSKEWVLTFGGAQDGDVGDFTVTAWGSGGVSPARATGRLAVSGDPLTLDDGGKLLSEVQEAGGTIAIMGDSFSSGEGAGEYLPGTATSDERCHRSLATYLAAYIEAEELLACSGAVIRDLTAPKSDRVNEPAQLDRLQDLTPSPDVVFLTIGGNDAEFGNVIASCALPGDCTRSPSATVRRFYAILSHTGSRLAKVYRAVDDGLNTERAVRSRDGRPGAVVVLAYPRLFGHPDRVSCPYFTRNEVRFFNAAAKALNFTIRQAVEQARAQGANVYFAPDVEHAVYRGNGACSSDPLIHPVDVSDYFSEGRPEIMHPTRPGYVAITDRLIRASRIMPDPPQNGRALAAAPRTVEAGDPVSSVALDGAGSDVAHVRPEDAVEITASGFAAGSPVSITINSAPRTLASVDADDTGDVRAIVYVPSDLEPGRHAVQASGLTDDGDSLTFSRQVAVGVPQPQWVSQVTAVSALLLGLGLAVAVRLAARGRD